MKINSAYVPGERFTWGDEIRVGYVPLMDAAPLIVAVEKGFFDKYGVNVLLERELGWAAIRDKMVYGELHAAHALAGMVWSTSLGIRCQKRPCATGLIINAHGNAITLSRELSRVGVRDAKSFAVRVRMDRRIRSYTLGVVAGVSSHFYLMKRWLASGGLDISRDVRIVTLPPSLMASHLEAGNIDGFCVGEPWNSVAVARHGGVVVATSRDIERHHPEKVLMASSDFIVEREEEYISLAAAVLEGCRYCQLGENREEVAEILSKKRYLNIEAGLLKKSLSGRMEGQAGRKAPAYEELHLFYGSDVNQPTPRKARQVWSQIEETAVYPFLSSRELSATVEEVFLKELFGKIEERVAMQAHPSNQVEVQVN